MKRTQWFRVAILLALIAMIAAACGSSDSKKSTTTTTTSSAASSAAEGSAGGKLVGTFKITAGDCAAGAVTAGSYFQMVQSGGTIEAGPYVPNADSTCGDKNFSALIPGADGGLITGRFQTQPPSPFDAAKNGVALLIVQPLKFFGTGFAVSTNPTDPQTSAAVTAPSITADAEGKLTGDLRAVTVAWNGQQFNQGSPKPDDSHPGNTKDLTGTYDSATGAYTLQWSSEIVGGPFNGFTGIWHLVGTFVATK
ncbi:MAG: hypothetical protein WBD02_08840 [Acidimicrobiia bacterium]